MLPPLVMSAGNEMHNFSLSGTAWDGWDFQWSFKEEKEKKGKYRSPCRCC